MQILHAATDQQIADAKSIFAAYAESLEFDLDFQDFDGEMAGVIFMECVL